MKNYEAILKLSVEQMASFLDEIYCTGLNTGMYATKLPSEEAADILIESPFAEEWLLEDAEPALLPPKEGEDRELLNAFVIAVLRRADISPDEE
ncbi:MAG: hypothetical protein IKY12_01010 [Clostridia bacterium]|nr:hypothetical protein [Clostridia bacterium]